MGGANSAATTNAAASVPLGRAVIEMLPPENEPTPPTGAANRTMADLGSPRLGFNKEGRDEAGTHSSGGHSSGRSRLRRRQRDREGQAEERGRLDPRDRACDDRRGDQRVGGRPPRPRLD